MGSSKIKKVEPCSYFVVANNILCFEEAFPEKYLYIHFLSPYFGAHYYYYYLEQLQTQESSIADAPFQGSKDPCSKYGPTSPAVGATPTFKSTFSMIKPI